MLFMIFLLHQETLIVSPMRARFDKTVIFSWKTRYVYNILFAF